MSQRATLTGEEYHELIRRWREVELQRLQAQLAVTAAEARRDRCIRILADKHGLPAEFQTLAWNDETLEIDVT